MINFKEKEEWSAIADRLAAELKKALLGYYVTVLTDARMRKTGNPFYGRVKKRTTYYSPILGGDYRRIIDRRTRQCNPDWFRSTASETSQPFNSDSTSQSSWKQTSTYYNDFILQSISNPDQFYLSLGSRPTTRYYTTWLVDGREATPKEIEALLPFLYTHSKEDARQSARGIPPEKQYRPWQVKLENIVEIRQGERVIYRNENLNNQLNNGKQ